MHSSARRVIRIHDKHDDRREFAVAIAQLQGVNSWQCDTREPVLLPLRHSLGVVLLGPTSQRWRGRADARQRALQIAELADQLTEDPE